MLPASAPTPPVTATFDQGSFPRSPPLPTWPQEHVPLRVHRLRRIPGDTEPSFGPVLPID